VDGGMNLSRTPAVTERAGAAPASSTPYELSTGRRALRRSSTTESFLSSRTFHPDSFRDPCSRAGSRRIDIASTAKRHGTEES